MIHVQSSMVRDDNRKGYNDTSSKFTTSLPLQRLATERNLWDVPASVLDGPDRVVVEGWGVEDVALAGAGAAAASAGTAEEGATTVGKSTVTYSSR